jgi:hypothetical protein
MSTFYSYTAQELQGSGSLISTQLSKLQVNTPYVFRLPSDYSGSTYFVLETARNANQIYDSASPKPFSNAIIFPIYETVDMIKSDYITSFVLANGNNRFVIYPIGAAIPGDKVYLRGTGDVDLIIEETALASGTWDTISNNWEDESNLWGV